MIVTLALRVLQLVFAGVVLALSAILIKDYGPGHSPSLTSYGAFCGGASVIIAMLGIASIFIDALQGIIILALDGIASFFLLAGGIAYAATIKVGSCSNDDYLSAHNNPFAPSSNKDYGTDDLKKYAKFVINDAIGRCREVQASTAFIWFTSAAFVATLALTFLGRGKRGSNNIV